jgi:putative oxidoreductase
MIDIIARIMQWLFPCFLSPKQDKVCRHVSCILHWLFRFILAGIFIYSGYIKVESRLLFEAVLYRYALFPNQYVPIVAQYFPWFEIALGLLLLIGFRWKIRCLAGASTVLLLFFIVILATTYLRGIEADCGCFSFEDRISPKTIARDSLMLIPALYLLFAGPLLRRHLKNKNREP